MSAGFSLEEETLFNTTGDAVLRRLRKTRNPGDLLAVLRTAQRDFERALASAPAAARAQIACHAGCDACCHAPVGVQAHEVLIAAEYIQTHFSPLELEDTIARAAAQRQAFALSHDPGAPRTNLPCALLRAGNCSIYSARPEICRSHHSHNASACRSNLDPANAPIDVFIPAVRGRMFAVMLAIDEAVAEAGFDDEAYDFGSALHEALTDSLCAVRWMQRQPAFAVSSLEDAPENPAVDPA